MTVSSGRRTARQAAFLCTVAIRRAREGPPRREPSRERSAALCGVTQRNT